MKKLETPHPNQIQKLDFLGDPLQVATALSHRPGFIFLDSSGNLPQNYDSPLSIIGIDPIEIYNGDLAEITSLENVISAYSSDDKIPRHIPQGGLFGWIDYEGSYCFGLYSNCLIYDHSESQWYEVGDVCNRMKTPSLLQAYVGEFKPHMSMSDYVSKVKKIQKYIKDGDIYQVNLTQKFSSHDFRGDLFSLYQTLRVSAPAPMAAYCKLGEREILSSSPETFLQMQGNKVVTCPIKGTRPRFKDTLKDQNSAIELQHSMKENAELVMITDLERNDLGKVCAFGSVVVEAMLRLESLEHVHHLVSVVSGKIKSGLSHFDVVRACFPGGSITGAPKKRAMEIIEELEDEARGLYTGSIGYIGIGGASQLNIAIRTLVRDADTLHYHVGAGIVADSDPEAEYNETLHKAKGIQGACVKHA